MQVLQVTANNDVSTIIGNALFLAILIFAIINFLAAYYSLNLSRMLIDRLEKSRAIWTGSVSILLSTTLLLFIFTPETGPYSAIWVISLVIFILALAGLIDSTIRVAIEQDYFHRNTLYWKKLRYLFWAGILFIFVLGPILTFTGFPNLTSGLALDALAGIVPFVYGIAALFVSGKRSKDRKMRSYLRWLGLAVLVLLGVALDSYITTGGGEAFLLFVVLAYFLYRASKSLSSTNKLSKEASANKLHEK
jgi:hypothetical protein